MMRFAFLGTSASVASRERDTTALVFAAGDASLLVDCGGSPVQRLLRLGIDPLSLTHVALTHLHADHAYGLPSLVQALRGMARTAPLDVVCRPEHADPVRTLLAVFGLWERAGMYAVRLRPLDPGGSGRVDAGPFALTAAPSAHGAMPGFAVRVEAAGAPAVVYSSDTEASDAVVALARGARTLVHDATSPARDAGRYGAHATAADAGDVARRAGVERLLLAHVAAPYHGSTGELAEEARRTFSGAVEVARELVWYDS